MAGLRFCSLTTFYPPFNFGGDCIDVQRTAARSPRAATTSPSSTTSTRTNGCPATSCRSSLSSRTASTSSVCAASLA